jgi:threonine dehydratase
MGRVPTIDNVRTAEMRLAGHAVRTPLLYSPFLSERLQARIYLKPECLQRTGSFKFRGAWNALSALDPTTRQRGVIAVSSGNHAQGVAEAARLFGVGATIVMPADAPLLKRQRTERSGARVITYDRASADRDLVVADVVAQHGGAFVHPFNDTDVIAGQGTVGLEIAADCAALGVEPNVVSVPCSGGGLAAGVALAVRETFPNAEILVAEPAGFDDYARSLAAGAPQSNERLAGSICDSLLAPAPGAIGWEINRSRLAGGVTATDAEALHAAGLCFDELRLAVEPSGAVGLAALLQGRPDITGKVAVLVLSGGNIGDATLAEAVAAYRSAEAS